MSATPRPQLPLSIVLLSLLVALGVGAALKAPCAGATWDGRQYRLLCYTDIVPLLGTEQLTGGRLPYLDPCEPSDASCDEYPVLTMYSMRAAAWLASSHPGFFVANALLLSIAAAAAAAALYRLVGDRALYLAAAPTLAVHAFTNWDLIAVALATGAILAFLRRRDVLSGVLLGLGAAAKLYPALLVLPLVLHRARERHPDGGIHLAWAAAVTWIAVNLPFAVGGTDGWLEFFRLSSRRPTDWDSLWSVACHAASDRLACPNTGIINLASAALLLGLATVVYLARRRLSPSFPRWTFGFPLLVVFLLTSKVYSPQFSLWLLPWFALALPSLPWFLAFSAADVGVFVTRFAWFGNLDGMVGGWVDTVPIEAFHLAVVLRAVVLVGCVVAWVLRAPAPVPGALPAPEPPQVAERSG